MASNRVARSPSAAGGPSSGSSRARWAASGPSTSGPFPSERRWARSTSTTGPNAEAPPWAPTPSSTWRPEPASTRRARLVLPTPASPASRTSDPRPASASAAHACSRACSRSRPMSWSSTPHSVTQRRVAATERLGPGRLDVLVDAEEVAGVPLVLQGHEPGVLLGPVAGPDPLFALVGFEVQVDPSGGERGHRVREPPHPVQMQPGLGWVLPGRDRVGHVGGVPMPGGGRVVGDLAHGAAMAEEDGLGRRARHLGDLGSEVHVGVDGLVREPAEMEPAVVVQHPRGANGSIIAWNAV